MPKLTLGELKSNITSFEALNLSRNDHNEETQEFLDELNLTLLELKSDVSSSQTANVTGADHNEEAQEFVTESKSNNFSSEALSSPTNAHVEMIKEFLAELESSGNDKDFVLYDGNPENASQSEMRFLYLIVFDAFETGFQKGHNILQGTAPADLFLKRLHDALDMRIPYHPPDTLTRDMAHFKNNLITNKDNIPYFRGDTRDPKEVFGLEKGKEKAGFIPRSPGGLEVLVSPVESNEEHVICCSKKFRTSAFFPQDITTHPETWVYVVIPDTLYDVHKHAKTFLPAKFRTNEKQYNYIQNRLHGYEIITDGIPSEKIVAAVKVLRLSGSDLLTHPTQFIIKDIIVNQNCSLEKEIKNKIISGLTQMRDVNSKTWDKLRADNNINELTTEERKTVEVTSIQEAYKNPHENEKYRRRIRSMVEGFFEHNPIKEIENAVKESARESKETEEEKMDKIFKRFGF